MEGDSNTKDAGQTQNTKFTDHSVVNPPDTDDTNSSSLDDYILRYPAARALQVMGYKPSSIHRGLLHLQQAGHPICPMKLLDIITCPEENGLANRENEKSLNSDCDSEYRTAGASEKAQTSPQYNQATLRLLEENRRLKMMKTCKICFVAEVNNLLLPCRHLPSCETCTRSIRNCPVCRRLILGTVKTYLF